MSDARMDESILDDELISARKNAMAHAKAKKADAKPKSNRKARKAKAEKKRKDPMHIKRKKHLDTLLLVIFGGILFLIISHPGDFIFGFITSIFAIGSINLWAFLGGAVIIGAVAFVINLFR